MPLPNTPTGTVFNNRDQPRVHHGRWEPHPGVPRSTELEVSCLADYRIMRGVQVPGSGPLLGLLVDGNARSETWIRSGSGCVEQERPHELLLGTGPRRRAWTRRIQFCRGGRATA